MDVTYELAALKGLKAMPKADAAKMIAAIRQVADHHPQRLGFVTEMREQAGYWRARKGDWRAIYRLTDTAVVVVNVDKRAEIYR